MKVYMIFASINERVYDEVIKFYLPKQTVFQMKDGKYHGLYAWTTNKKLLKEFMDGRGKSNIYKVGKKELTDDSFIELKDKFDQAELKDYTYFSAEKEGKKEYVHVISTKNEHNIVLNEGQFYIQEKIDMLLIERFPLMIILNDKLLRALNLFGLVDEYINVEAWSGEFSVYDMCDILGINAEDYEDESDIMQSIRDMASNNESYNLNFYGYSKSNQIKEYNNEFGILIELFGYMFVGDGK